MIGRQKACVTPSTNPEKPVRPMATRLQVRAPSWSAPVPFALEQLRRFLLVDHLAGIRGRLVGGRLNDLANGCPPCWTLLISHIHDLRTPLEQVGFAAAFGSTLNCKYSLFNRSVALNQETLDERTWRSIAESSVLA